MNASGKVEAHDETLLRRAIIIAREAVARGERPFGAVLARNHTILAEAHNAVVSEGDPTQHAELRLISQTSRRLGLDAVAESVLYASTEPCEMCAGAITRAGIRRVVFGCRDEVFAKISGRRTALSGTVILGAAAEPIVMVGPLLEAEAADLHSAFWSQDRS